MIRLKLAYRNAIKHRWSSIVLMSVFTIAVLSTFWMFGFSNYLDGVLVETFRDSYGDMVFFVNYAKRGDLARILKDVPAAKIVYEREVNAIFDNPKKSSIIRVIEITGQNRGAIGKYLRPAVGTVPTRPDEALLSEIYAESEFKVGDTFHITTTTPDKIINTLKYTVSGINRADPAKTVLNGFIVTEESMNLLVNSSEHVNMVYVYLGDRLGERAAVKATFDRITELFAKNGIGVKDSWTVYHPLDKLEIFNVILGAGRMIVFIVILPLVGAVVGAIVWMYSWRRRKEIWTFVSLGMKDREVLSVMIMEYVLIAAAGVVLGIGLGYVTSFLSDAGNVLLKFSITFRMPLIAKIGVGDLALIPVVLFLCVIVCSMPPIRRIIKSTPFSY
ncbi:MAG TPA: ABC transporter permease [Spirochaetota bacterium]|nr:ABC transporter permease [Spirochaetota bacterium]HPI23170.1 ABC transporter permease [Spirochaetota bacterium]